MKDKDRKKKICYIEDPDIIDITDNTFFINLFCYYNEFKLKMQLYIYIIKDYNIINIINSLDDKLNLLIKDFLNNYLYINDKLDFNNNIIQFNFNIKNNKQFILNEIDYFKKKIESLDITNKILKNKILNFSELLNKTHYELYIIIN
tara:strand:- start:205 stop:645 length:441 start_codon:yes stop_codon:yes gene_type:complete